MTLFDAMVALVILGLAAVGFLGAFQSTTRSAQNSAEWVQAVGYAEAAMEETKLGSAAPAIVLETGFGRAIEVQPWPAAPGVQLVSVSVTMPRGTRFVLRRLVYAP